MPPCASRYTTRTRGSRAACSSTSRTYGCVDASSAMQSSRCGYVCASTERIAASSDARCGSCTGMTTLITTGSLERRCLAAHASKVARGRRVVRQPGRYCRRRAAAVSATPIARRRSRSRRMAPTTAAGPCSTSTCVLVAAVCRLCCRREFGGTRRRARGRPSARSARQRCPSIAPARARTRWSSASNSAIRRRAASSASFSLLVSSRGPFTRMRRAGAPHPSSGASKADGMRGARYPPPLSMLELG